MAAFEEALARFSEARSTTSCFESRIDVSWEV
jgi:hypothetical protein